MKMKMKKLLAAALAFCLLLTFAPLAFAGLEGGWKTAVPTVYLQGQGSTLYADKNDPQSEQIHDIDVPDGYVEDVAKSLAAPLAKGVFLNDWDEWVDGFVEGVAPLFEKQALDENGEASNGSGIKTSSGNFRRQNADGTYPLDAYTPFYDWRLDPMEIAKDIHTYIEQVKRATGAQKVNLMGRSIGASVALAYLAEYGAEGLDSVVLYCPSFLGMEAIGKAFAGKVELDPEAIDRFAEYYAGHEDVSDLGDEELISVLLDVISVSVTTHALDLPAGALERIYAQICAKVYPRLLVRMYGSMPSFWSLVGDEDYEDAKRLIFAGQEDVYAGLIEKTDRFHYDVLNKSAEIINGLVDSGAKIQIVAKYGVPMLPVVENASVQSDMLTSVKSATLGATCADMGKTLSAEAVAAAESEGRDRFLSPDLEIDASTALLPEHTWFIKNLAHRSMPPSVNVLFETILNHDGYTTVFDEADAPQYLYYDELSDALAPLTADDPNPGAKEEASFFTRIVNILRFFFKTLVERLRKAFGLGE